MRTLTYLILSLLIVSNLPAQENDDVYFSPDDLKENASYAEYYEEEYEEYDDIDDSYYKDGYESSSESYRDENGNNYITNNYYGDYYDNGYDYTTKLRRYYSPYSGFEYYSPCYVRSYYGYDYSPGWSFSIGWGVSSYWGYSPYSYYSYGGWYNPYSWGYHGYYGYHGYHNNYWSGYNHGYYDGYYNGYYGGNYNGHDGYSGNTNGYYYGPRRSAQSSYSSDKKSSSGTGRVSDMSGTKIKTPPANTKEINKIEDKTITTPVNRSPNTKTIIKDSPSKEIHSRPAGVQKNPDVKENKRVIYSQPNQREIDQVQPRVIEKSPQERNYYNEPPRKDNRPYEKPVEQRNINRYQEKPTQPQNRQPQIIEKPAPIRESAPDQNRDFREYSKPNTPVEDKQPRNITPQRRFDNRTIKEPDRGKTYDRQQYSTPPATQPKSPSPGYQSPPSSTPPQREINRGGGNINRTPKSNGPVYRPR